jgi:peptide deformylase
MKKEHLSESEKMQDELEPIPEKREGPVVHPTEFDESDDLEMAKSIESNLLDGNGIERYKSPEIRSVDELQLLRFDDPFLQRVPAPFRFEDMDEHGGLEPKEIKERLLKVMIRDGGVGLSANQVGINAACFVIGDGKEFEKIFINPKIVGVGEEQDSIKEGCLSFPGLYLMVKRPTKCVIQYWDEEGEEIQEEYQGVSARVILHEYDHMLGQNFTMRVSRVKLERALKALSKKTKKYQRNKAKS